MQFDVVGRGLDGAKMVVRGMSLRSSLGSRRYSSSSANLSLRRASEGNIGRAAERQRSSKGRPRLRDKLCLLIRTYELDPILVKRYAADFCGTETLRDASRDLVESFVSTIAEEAANNREHRLHRQRTR
jgi:hypothetical protein